jgi:hypothetical protein
MQTTARLEAPCPPDAVYHHIARLERYPAWMPLVHSAQPVGADAWLVELRTRVGPLARSKRLRMVLADEVVNRSVTFERSEVDDREHSSWVLRADVQPSATGSVVTMHLAYGGSLWTGGLLQRVLDDEIRRGSERLLELVNDAPTH